MAIGTIGASGDSAVEAIPAGVGAKVRTVEVCGYNSMGTLSAGTYWINSDKGLDLWGADDSFIGSTKPGLNKVTVNADAAGEVFAAANDFLDSKSLNRWTHESTPEERFYPTVADFAAKHYYVPNNEFSFHVTSSVGYLFDTATGATTYMSSTFIPGASQDNNRYAYAAGWSEDEQTNYLYFTHRDGARLYYSSDKGATWTQNNLTQSADGYNFSYLTSVTTNKSGRFFALLSNSANDQRFMLAWGRGGVREGYFTIDLSSAASNQYSNTQYNGVVGDPSSDAILIGAYTNTSYTYVTYYRKLDDATLTSLNGASNQPANGNRDFARESSEFAGNLGRGRFNVFFPQGKRTTTYAYYGHFGVDSTGDIELDSHTAYPENHGAYGATAITSTSSFYPLGMVALRDRFLFTSYVNRKLNNDILNLQVKWGNYAFMARSDQNNLLFSARNKAKISDYPGSIDNGLMALALLADGRAITYTNGSYNELRHSTATIYQEV